jgi:transposase
MTPRAAPEPCADAGSSRGSPGAASSRASGWPATAKVVERSLAWLVGYRRLQVRYERHSDILLGFLQLACALICRNRLDRPKL